MKKKITIPSSKYQLSCDRKLQFAKPINLPSTNEDIYGLSVFIKTDEVFRDDEDGSLVVRNFKNNYNIIVSYDSLDKALAYSYVKGVRVGWKIDKYMLWYSSLGSTEISKERFEEILSEIGHLITTCYNLKATTYEIHEL